MRQLVGIIGLLLVLAACTTTVTPSFPTPPEPVYSLTVLEAEPIAPTLCGQPCWYDYRLVVEVDPVPSGGLQFADFTITTPAYPWPNAAIDRLILGADSYFSACEAATCELIFILHTYHVESTFYPAQLAYEDAVVVIEGPMAGGAS